jgi:hypothetical protein
MSNDSLGFLGLKRSTNRQLLHMSNARIRLQICRGSFETAAAQPPQDEEDL